MNFHEIQKCDVKLDHEACSGCTKEETASDARTSKTALPKKSRGSSFCGHFTTPAGLLQEQEEFCMNISDAWILEYSTIQGYFHVSQLVGTVRSNSHSLQQGRSLEYAPVAIAASYDECVSMMRAWRKSGLIDNTPAIGEGNDLGH